MIELGVLVTFLIIFLFIFYKDKKDRERTEKMISVIDTIVSQTLTHLEKTNDKFYQVVSDLQIEVSKTLSNQQDKQFKFLEGQSDKLFEKLQNPEPKIEKLSNIDFEEKMPNSIEEDRKEEFPLMEFPNIPMTNNLKIQVEGEEEVFPVSFDNTVTDL